MVMTMTTTVAMMATMVAMTIDTSSKVYYILCYDALRHKSLNRSKGSLVFNLVRLVQSSENENVSADYCRLAQIVFISYPCFLPIRVSSICGYLQRRVHWLRRPL